MGLSSGKHLPSITVNFIEHRRQRYDTCGDYQRAGNLCWWVTISKLKDWRYEALVLIHELVEVFLCKHHKISWQTIDKWDLAHPDSDDPGAIRDCPYRKEHMAATRIERLLALLLGVSWKEYEQALGKLKWK